MTVYENEGAKPAMEFKKELDKGNIPQASTIFYIYRILLGKRPL